MIGARSCQGRVIPRVIPKPKRALKKLLKTASNCVQALASVGSRLRVMFQDEGRFGRISTPRRCWAPRGMRPEVPCQMVREYTYGFVALSPHDGVLDSLILPQVCEEAMSLFLREVSE